MYECDKEDEDDICLLTAQRDKEARSIRQTSRDSNMKKSERK